MTPAEMAALHDACFTTPRPWSEAEIADLLASPLVFALTQPRAFLLGRVVAGEAELLTIAVHPDQRRAGLGGALVGAFLTEATARIESLATARAAAVLAPTGRRDPPADEPAGGRADEGAHEDEVEAHAGGARRLTT